MLYTHPSGYIPTQKGLQIEQQYIALVILVTVIMLVAKIKEIFNYKEKEPIDWNTPVRKD